MAKKIRIQNSNGVLERQIDVDDTTSHIFIYDGNDNEIMDAEAHASRHADGGADALPANSISNSMIQDSAVTTTKIADGNVTSPKVAAYSQYHTANVTTGVTIGAKGSPATIVSLTLDTDYNNLIPLTIKGTPSGLGTAETATFAVVATLDDGTTVTLGSKTTAAGSTATETFTIADLDFSGIADDKKITKLELTAESSASSTTATATGSITALENYV